MPPAPPPPQGRGGGDRISRALFPLPLWERASRRDLARVSFALPLRYLSAVRASRMAERVRASQNRAAAQNSLRRNGMDARIKSGHDDHIRMIESDYLEPQLTLVSGAGSSGCCAS